MPTYFGSIMKMAFAAAPQNVANDAYLSWLSDYDDLLQRNRCGLPRRNNPIEYCGIG